MEIMKPVQIEGGWRVRETDRYFVDVLIMAFGNTRIVLTPKDHPEGYERGWCYNGTLLATFATCYTFNPDQDEEPEGWVKESGTERRACKARYPKVKDGPHEHYVAACPDCGP